MMAAVKGDAIIVATGANENVVNFKGWTKPGVIGAGAAQTLMNLHHIQPGSRILMLGTGNVGLVVAYQLMQAGCEVAAMVDMVYMRPKWRDAGCPFISLILLSRPKAGIM